MIKTIKFYALLLLATVVVFGCSKYDDTELRNDVSDLQSRVEKLEKWCETTNTQISALQGVVTALEAKDFVTGVTPITEGSVTVGYTITFSKSNAVTIKNGTNGKDGVNGTAPVIGVAKHTDGLYYWTVKSGAADATWMLDAEGKMIRTTGDKGADGSIGADGKTPELSVAADTDGKLYWKVNGEWLMSDGKKVQATGDKGETGAAGSAGEDGEAGKDGDSIFKKDGIDLTDPNNVTLTLADGTTKITFPRTSAVKIFDSFDNFKIAALDVATPLTLSLNIKDADYKAIKAELTSSAGLMTAIKTRAAGTPWQVAITAPTFKADGTIDAQPVVSITAPTGAAEGDIALLKVTIIDSKGEEHASTRVLFYSTKVDVESVSIDESLALVVNEEKTLTATVLPAEATQTVTWTSSNEAVATVSADGKVKGIAAGAATITATTEGGGFTATCAVTVENIALTGITLKATTTINKGATEVLVPTFSPTNATNKTVTWASSNLSVATVDATGKVTAVAAGEANITVTTAEGNFTQTCKVTVTDSVYFENEGEAGIDGSSWEKAYAIKTKQQLVELSNRVNGSQTYNWNAKYYKLIADIDLGTNNTDIWNSIGDGNKIFKGHFDGGNHAVTGKLIGSANAMYFGIFGYCEGAEIKDLHFNGTIDTITSPNAYVGSIAGQITKSSVILHCSNSADIVASGTLGGIVGACLDSKITACTNSGTMKCTQENRGAAGIASNASNNGNIFGCINKGATIEASHSSGSATGGIIGVGAPVACWSIAATITSSRDKGAIVGWAYNINTAAKADNCYWKEISGIKGAGSGSFTNFASFTGDQPTPAQIAAMNAAWAAAEPSGREYQFNAATGEIERIP